ncbi:hypothetical protein WN51_04287 [Melipona quadrifasciata]|uniref:Uncharacterized protein n=1 Tax=Melipona quadrifasciata TaxID=166423 RepID=A0A0N0U3I6_9HYME|nr:hypothetical protein WN51_04287 [Melipona quadrifasciata]
MHKASDNTAWNKAATLRAMQWQGKPWQATVITRDPIRKRGLQGERRMQRADIPRPFYARKNEAKWIDGKRKRTRGNAVVPHIAASRLSCAECEIPLHAKCNLLDQGIIHIATRILVQLMAAKGDEGSGATRLLSHQREPQLLGFHGILRTMPISGSYLVPFFHLLGHVYAQQITLTSPGEYNEANPRSPRSSARLRLDRVSSSPDCEDVKEKRNFHVEPIRARNMIQCPSLQMGETGKRFIGLMIFNDQ